MPYDMKSDSILPNGPAQDMRPFHQKLVDMLMLRGKPQDINLESEGTVDPQLPKPPLDALKHAFDVAQRLALDPESVRGLQRAR